MANQQGDDQQLLELALFAGAGGGILGGKLLGWRTIGAVEINEYSASVLIERQNDGILEAFPVWDNVETFRRDNDDCSGFIESLRAVRDRIVISGGFPCQEISIAGNGEGLDGARSGLWREQIRIIREIRPRYAFVENSSTLTSRGLGTILRDLAEVGYDAEWGVFSAGELGSWHNRPRLWILAFDPSEVGIERSRKRPDPCINGPWRQVSKSDLGSALEGNSDRFRTAKPILRGAEYGMAGWLGRIEAIGNGQVPCVAANAWKLLGGP